MKKIIFVEIVKKQDKLVLNNKKNPTSIFIKKNYYLGMIYTYCLSNY